jgi:DNA-binding beta-propeller fold protein YncE
MSNQRSNCIPCGIQTFQRNTFFNGKLLTERDLNAEQAYLVGKDRLHNSLLHGMGTVCGLKVVAHPNPECRDQFVVLEPGVALDCCGREIIVTQKVLVPILQRNPNGQLVPVIEIDPDGNDDLFISLCYQERLNELIPVLLPDCDCADQTQAYNRVSEEFRVLLSAQPAGQRPPVLPPLNAKIEWLHTLTLARQSPRALVVDEELGQLYLAAQAIAPDSEEGDLRARLYAYHTDNHDLFTAVDGGDEPTDLAISVLGDRIYLATTMQHGEAVTPVIAIFEENEIRAQTQPSKTIALPGAARLLVSPTTRALYALVLDDGGETPQAQLLRWDDDAILTWLTDETPDLPPAQTIAIGDPLDGRAGAGMVNMTLDGKFIFIADTTRSRLLVVDLAAGMVLTPSITGFGEPLAVAGSRDSQFVYILWNEAANTARLTRYELDTTAGLVLREDGRGAQWAATALDLTLAPNERWAYILQVSGDQGEVQAIDIDELAKPGTEPVDARGTRASVSGTVHFERNAVRSGRIYVAAEDEASDQQPERGLVAVLDVKEEACTDRFSQLINGCPACSGGSADEHCVVVATIPRFRVGAQILNPDEAGADDNQIDNLTHRPLVPNTNTIVDVIRCLLEQGLAEGVPGPRGPSGAQGLRGPGILEVTTTGLPGGAEPTATLEPIAGDPEGDQRLALGIPRGADGDPGPRGPGITEVTVTTLPAGSNATATLQPIAGDPEGDQRLALGIPRGADGSMDDPDLTHINGLSWVHNRPMSIDEFDRLIVDPVLDNDPESPREIGIGLVISFDRPVRMETIIDPKQGNEREPRSDVFELYVRIRDDQFEVEHECVVPQVICQPVEVQQIDPDGLITVIAPRPGAEVAEAVRLVLRHSDLSWFRSVNPMFLRVVLRTDFVLDDVSGKAVDGNNIGGLVPRRPSGNGRQGDGFESWFRVFADQ